MKSGTLCFNAAALRKNVTRFAPVWVLYTVLMLMFMMLMLDSSSYTWFAESVAQSIGVMAVFNFIYAFICAQLLLGDLYTSRMCNALHALPPSRESWFATHVASGLLFSLVPNILLTLLAMLMVGELWMIPLLWLAAATLQYVFFFGVALLSGYLVGNRFAMALVYIIFNGFSLIVYWLVHYIYEPLLYGITLEEDVFYLLCPVVQMGQLNTEYIHIDTHYNDGYLTYLNWETGIGWGYMAICAVIGIAAGAVALLCYKKRQLEVAGDFMAVKKLAPVFLILYTLCGGACCQGFFDLLMGENSVLYLLLGLAIGFFTGLMLLERTVRVFRKKTLLGFGAVLLGMVLSIVLVRIDPVGITRWVPEAGQVKSVRITTGGAYYYQENGIRLEDEAAIAEILSVHQHGVDNRNEGTNGRRDVRLFLTYTMSSGAVRQRQYYIDTDTQAGQILKKYLSSPEAVLGELYTQAEDCRLTSAEFYGAVIQGTDAAIFADAEDLQSLMDAVVADCLAGNMATDGNYYSDSDYIIWIQLEYRVNGVPGFYREIRGFEQCENLMQWMKAHQVEMEKY